MKKAKAIRDYVKFSDAELLKISSAVSTGMKDNPPFLNGRPAVDAMDAESQLFENALAASNSRDSVRVAEKKIIRISLTDKMDILLRYVNSIAEGDRPKLLSTGFTISKEYGSTKDLGEITKFKAVPGRNSGEVKVKVAQVLRAKFYEFQYALSPVQNDTWQYLSTTATTGLLTGLQRGKEYDMRVCAVAIKGVRGYSDVISIMVV